MNGIRLTTDLVGIDWSALRRALIDDDFDNGRSAEQYEASARASRLNVFALRGEEIVGNARLLSDGVCNAYIVDVWTRSDLRRQGLASEMVRLLLADCQGQHVALFTDDAEAFYTTLGFRPETVGMSQVVGPWLVRTA